MANRSEMGVGGEEEVEDDSEDLASTINCDGGDPGMSRFGKKDRSLV